MKETLEIVVLALIILAFAYHTVRLIINNYKEKERKNKYIKEEIKELTDDFWKVEERIEKLEEIKAKKEENEKANI
jgi:Na+-transporting methylmalonyl-CoA/oxaloacetate decarboxylase gamma subunit